MQLWYLDIRKFTYNTVRFYLCVSVCGFMINDISDLQQLGTPQSPKQSSLAGWIAFYFKALVDQPYGFLIHSGDP